jgi:hypothetical protein
MISTVTDDFQLHCRCGGQSAVVSVEQSKYLNPLKDPLRITPSYVYSNRLEYLWN